MAKKLPPCDGTTESWGLLTLIVVGLAVVIELMAHHDGDWFTETILTVTLGLLARHHWRFHRHAPVDVPHQELIP